MSAFIVISAKENLNWIVDGIKDCRPHNPDVTTYLSIGKIKREGEDKYLYEYTVFSKHTGDDTGNDALSRTAESDIPRNLFSNQIAQFLNVCENEGEQINIFFLDNPTTDADFEQSSWLINEIKAVYDSHKITNFQLVRILFSYEIDRPTDVNKQVSQMILKQLTKVNLDDSDDFPTRILYIDNQNRNGAAICLNKEEHDIMIPRMLCDFMMLLSNKNDSYNVSSAISGQNQMFAIGYSECMYYHDDVFKYYDLAGRRDLLEYLLETKNDDESLDWNRHPIGLEDRQKRFAPLYEKVPYDADIDSYPNSIDKAIDDIIVSLKDDIIDIRHDATVAASEKDAAETKCKLIAHLKENNLIPEEISEEALNERYLSIAKDAGVDIEHFTVTAAAEQVQKDYPEYIDRHRIYEEYLIEDEGKEEYKSSHLDANILEHERLIKFIQTGQFKRYVRAKCEAQDKKQEQASSGSEMLGEKQCFIKRLIYFLKCRFFKTMEPEIDSEVDVAETPTSIARDWISLRESIASISEMYSKRNDYFKLKEKVSLIRSDIETFNSNIHNFKLTVHCSSVDSLIDLDKLEEYHQSGREARLRKIVEQWSHQNESDRTYDAIFEVLKEVTKWDVFNFYYINWSKPLDFIKDISLQVVCEHLIRKSQPFVNTYTLEPNAENLTSYVFYTDNKQWCEDIRQKRVSLKNDNMLSCTFSRHICSKICMFQFLQMSQKLIEGLVDIHEN